MLHKAAFNALLKTLEEPPPHVKFIFATTELRKIPVTIISRCQKFDLKRVEMDELSQHLVNVSAKESIALPADCASLIAAAAEGSVRDSLSLLDQAIAMHTDAAGNITITPESVRDMLGLADKSQSFTLLKLLFDGNTAEALTAAQAMHAQGADAAMLLSDLLDIVHYLTRIVVAPVLANNLNYSPAEQAIAKEMAANLNVPALTRAWQILTKGAEEMRHADNTAVILEMILVRLGYASALPSPAELVRTLRLSDDPMIGLSVKSNTRAPNTHSPLEGESKGASPSVGGHSYAHPTPHDVARATSAPPQGGSWQPVAPLATASRMDHRIIGSSDHQAATAQKIEPVALAEVHSFLEVVELFEARREPILATHLINDMRVVSFSQGRIEVKPVAHMNADVAARINRRLAEWTGTRWNLTFTNDAEGEPTVREQRARAAAQARDYAVAHPKVQAVLAAFPDAKVIDFIPSKP